MTGRAYEPDRARQLRVLLWVVVAMAGVMALFAALLLLGGDAAAGRVLLVLVLPAVVMAALAGWSLRLLADDSATARPALAATAVVAIVVGLLLSRVGPGMLVGVVGILLLLVALLPGRRAAA